MATELLPFSPYRVVGHVCGDAPASLTELYGAPVLMVAAGRTFHLFRGVGLTMLRGGPTFEHSLAAVAQSGKRRYCAEGSQVHAFLLHRPLWSRPHAPLTHARARLLVAQDDLLFSAGDDKAVVVWDSRTGERLTTFLVAANERPTAMVVPTGYTNKLLLATAEGALQLFNFRSGQCLFHARGREPSAILCLATSAFRDVVAYGTSGGRAVVFDFGRDAELAAFRHDGAAQALGDEAASDATVPAVTAVAFRTDREEFLLSGTSRGDVAVWDLTRRCLDGLLTSTKQVASRREQLDSPHAGVPVHSLLPLPGTAVVVSGGADNALVQFRFDTVDGLGVLVRERRGHAGTTCTAVNFFNADLLVSSGDDQTLRVTHVFSDRASWELSQGKLGRRGRERHVAREALRVPPATALASTPLRQYQWASVVSLHEGSAQLCGWRMDRRALELKASGIATAGGHVARAVALSQCGNYAVVGYSSGHLCRIHLQNKSLHHFSDRRLSASAPQAEESTVAAAAAHAASIEIVHVTCSNACVVSGGLDGVLKLWGLANCALRRVVAAGGGPMTRSCLHDAASLIVVAQQCDIRVLACGDAGDGPKPRPHASSQPPTTASAAIRTFLGHRADVTALAVTPDTGRHVVSASGDGAVFLWDLAAGVCVGKMRAPSPATSLSFHPDGLFLASTHVGERGAFLWTNHLRYGFVAEEPRRSCSSSGGGGGAASTEADGSDDVSRLPLLHYPSARGEGDSDDDEGDDARGREKRAAKASANDGEGDGDGDEAAAEEGDGVELFDAATDVALLRRARDAHEAAQLDAIDCPGLRLASGGGAGAGALARDAWQTLVALDQIREKNQPLLPPKKRDVPFFLPTTSELRPTFIVPAPLASSHQQRPAAAAAAPLGVGSISVVHSLLLRGDDDAAMAALLAMPLADADIELRRVVDVADPADAAPLGSSDGGVVYTAEEQARFAASLAALLRFLRVWTARRRHVDFVQALLAVALKAHGSLIASRGGGGGGGGVVIRSEDFAALVAPELRRLLEAQRDVRAELEHLVAFPSALAASFTGTAMS